MTSTQPKSKQPSTDEATDATAISETAEKLKHPLAYYAWFPLEWRRSRRVQHMGYIARGLYRELLDEQWHKGFIPDNIEELAVIADCPEEVMTAEWPKIARHFVQIEEGNQTRWAAASPVFNGIPIWVL